MAKDEYSDDCPGCQPKLVDMKTGRVVPDDDPAMVKLRAAFATLSRDGRVSFHRVTCCNSRDPHDLAVIKKLADALAAT